MLDNLLEEAQTGKPDSLVITATGERDRRLFENENFVVVPSVSPIAVNHVMVVPKFPASGFWQVRKEELNDVLESLGELNPSSRDFLQFEHGVFTADEYRCGINQAHLHLLPTKPGFSQFLREKFTKMADGTDVHFFQDVEFSDLSNYQTHGTSYVVVRSGTKANFGIVGHRLASQIVRKFASEFGYSCSENWRDIENWDVFQTTLRSWRKLVG